MFKRNLCSFIILITLLQSNLFSSQQEPIQTEQCWNIETNKENKETTFLQNAQNWIKKHAKKVATCIIALGGSYLFYKYSSDTNNLNEKNKPNKSQSSLTTSNKTTTSDHFINQSKSIQPAESYSHKLNETISLEFVQADITKLAFTEGKKAAIVNAANDGLWAGGGVCGAIFEASGPQYHAKDKNGKLLYDTKGNKVMRWKLQDQCDAITRINGIACPEGEARYTDGGEHFEAKNIAVIHAVGPKGTNPNRKALLEGAYYNSLVEAEKNNVCEIAFPAISTAIFGYNSKDANPVALAAVAKYFKEYPESKIEKVIFVSYNATDFDQYKKDTTKFFTN